MAKIQTVGTIKEFLNSKEEEKTTIAIKAGALATPMLLLPKLVLAAGIDGAFGNVHSAIMRGFDAGVVLIIIFAGAAWGMGHRPKAIEIIIGVCCGYILARHAVDIRDFLKGI